MRRHALSCLLVPWLLTATATAETPPLALEALVQEFELENGLRLLVVENDESPTVGLATAFRVGAAEERPGINGVTHILEHMLFKGTTEIGTTDWKAERAHHERIEVLTWQIKEEQGRGSAADTARIRELLAERDREEEAAKRYAVDNELWGIYEEAGGQGLNAFTSYDATIYVLALPVNRLELWMYLESERLRRPILRQFYTEMQNILEERRQRVDSDPAGALDEQLHAVAFDAHWYGYPIVGYPSDIATITRTETEEWFRRHYAPNRLTLAVVGDVRAEDVLRMTREYFADIPRQQPPEPVQTFDIEKKGARRVEVEFAAEPRLMMAWHKPNEPHPDDAALHVISEILTGGRSARLRKRLVEERKILASVRSDHEDPGSRWPNLFLIEALPRSPHTAAAAEAAIWEELDKLTREAPSGRELTKVKNRIQASWVRDLASNQGLAIGLAYTQAVHDDWRVLLESRAALAAVTGEDVKRVARKTFRRNRTIIATLVEPQVEIDPAKEAAAREILERMVVALGGEEALANVRSAVVKTDVVLTTPAGPLNAEATNTYVVPDRMRGDVQMFGQTMSQCVSPAGVWRTQRGGAADVDGDEAIDMRAGLERDIFLLAYAAAADQYSVEVVDAAEGMIGIAVRGPSGRAFTVHLSEETLLPELMTYTGGSPLTGAPAEFVEHFSDWQEVEGLRRPQRIVTTVDGEKFAEATVTATEINAEIEADAFVRPTR